ncbi:hypothetical protein BN1708_020017, partial [Verticillium longisporum]
HGADGRGGRRRDPRDGRRADAAQVVRLRRVRRRHRVHRLPVGQAGRGRRPDQRQPAGAGAQRDAQGHPQRAARPVRGDGAVLRGARHSAG